jgi:hypothetical protein
VYLVWRSDWDGAIVIVISVGAGELVWVVSDRDFVDGTGWNGMM